MVPGAKLRREMELIGSASGFDVAGHLASTGRTFSNLVNEVEGVFIRARPGSDILVGLDGAQPPAFKTSDVTDSARSARLRRDVWEAFGVHLILTHNRDDERPQFEHEASKSFRVVWLTRDIVQNYGHKVFDDAIARTLSFESDWRKSIRPSIDSPLLLPETAFSAETAVATMWRRATRVREDRDSLGAVANVIGRFRKLHRRTDKWRDVENLTFARGPSHGGQHLPGRRRMKLTLTLPGGFHFDVRHDANRAFSVRDESGQVLNFQRYTNIDPHGYIRGGG